VVLEAAAAGRAGRALVGRQSRVRLHEVGPRLEMEIVKVSEKIISCWKPNIVDLPVLSLFTDAVKCDPVGCQVRGQ
jgi:hypothetical protein